MYYQLSKGKVAKSEKVRSNGIDYVVDYDAHGEVIGVEILNMKKALPLAASEAGLLLTPMRAKVAERSGR